MTSDKAKEFFGQRDRTYGDILYEEGKFQLNNKNTKEAISLF